MSLIELANSGLKVGDRVVLQRIDLRLEETESIGLVGPNGCGKTSVLRLVAGLERPTWGRVMVDGFDTRKHADAVRRRVGYVPEQLGVYPGLSIWQFLEFFACCAGMAAIERKTTIETFLKVVDLYDVRQLEAAQLSRGMRRRLALARALVTNPTVLLLDDPLGGLDARGRIEILEVLRELRSMGTTMIVSGHLLGDIVRLCSHVAVMREGRVIKCGPVLAVLDDHDGGQQVEMEVVLGESTAAALLAHEGDVSNVSVDGHVVGFTFTGDQIALATLLDRLVEQGVQVARFAPAPRLYDELAASLSEGNPQAATRGAR
ncbi:MAG: ABC transporter ATP-binding protein [Chloroflexi bacterium]|nr:ABC transporter ATP-binding protein [Chloroflexota bacterium]